MSTQLRLSQRLQLPLRRPVGSDIVCFWARFGLPLMTEGSCRVRVAKPKYRSQTLQEAWEPLADREWLTGRAALGGLLYVKLVMHASCQVALRCVLALIVLVPSSVGCWLRLSRTSRCRLCAALRLDVA